MGYDVWRRQHEKEVIDLIDQDRVSELSAFHESCEDDALQRIVRETAEQTFAQNPSLNLQSFAILFSEYLHQTYNVTPFDLELMNLVIFKSSMDQYLRNIGFVVGKLKDGHIVMEDADS